MTSRPCSHCYQVKPCRMVKTEAEIEYLCRKCLTVARRKAEFSRVERDIRREAEFMRIRRAERGEI